MRNGGGERAAPQFGHLHQSVASAQINWLGARPEAAKVTARIYHALGAASPLQFMDGPVDSKALGDAAQVEQHRAREKYPVIGHQDDVPPIAAL